MTTPASHRAPLTGPSVWHGKDIKDSKRWIRELTADAVEELDAALKGLRGMEWSEIRAEDVWLPTLGELWDDIADELENGCGIVKLKGFPVDRYSEEDLRRLYFAVGTHIGTPVFQNRSGELMRLIRDEGAHVGRTYGETKDEKGSTFLSSYARTLTNGGLRFHTDRTDVVGLLCVRQALAGGVSKLASTPAIHNAILERRPDLLDVLFQDYWRSRFGEEGTTKDGEGTTKETAYPLPIFGLRDGKFTSHYSLTFIEAAQLAPNVPKLTDAQREAIDMLMQTAEELCFEMTLEPGDLQLINSHVTYHGRTPFEDNAASGKDRMLMRLWLTMRNNRPLPKGHEVLWQEIEAGHPRGGIRQVAG
ncbi:TauD/TfdA family dioxygenase [Reyranella massiliensis]|uniref:TauD/TfdA family dioxygenase n=1 Tax=Reyranella massiliensis TaxID=445220 RepID=UPI000302297B|nr:TauD/TfdA family dioxygenase [Reyranella massiliensis]